MGSRWPSTWRGLLFAPSIAELFLLFVAARSLPSERFDGFENYPMSLLLVIKVAGSHSHAVLNTEAVVVVAGLALGHTLDSLAISML